MGGFTIGTTLNVGFPGTITRSGSTTFARQVRVTDANGPAFGNAVLLNTDNTYSDLAAAVAAGTTPTAAMFAGVANREVKSFSTFQAANGAFVQAGIGTYNPGDYADVITQGNTCVTVLAGTPLAGQPVFLRIATGGPAGTIIGGFEAAAATGNIKLANAFFTTGVTDSNGVAEITIQYPQA